MAGTIQVEWIVVENKKCRANARHFQFNFKYFNYISRITDQMLAQALLPDLVSVRDDRTFLNYHDTIFNSIQRMIGIG